MKLIGHKTNKAAIGARIRVYITENEAKRDIFLYVNSGRFWGQSSTQGIRPWQSNRHRSTGNSLANSGQVQTFQNLRKVFVWKSRKHARVQESSCPLYRTQEIKWWSHGESNSDLVIANDALYQLSYDPTEGFSYKTCCCAGKGYFLRRNTRPP